MPSKQAIPIDILPGDGIPRAAALTGLEWVHVVQDDGAGNLDSRVTSLDDIVALVPASGISQAFADGRYLQKADDLADLADIVAARLDLSVYSKSEVDAAIAGVPAGNWWAGHKPTAAQFPTTWKANATTTHIVLADDADVGLTFDSTDSGQAGGNFKLAVQAAPASDAVDWTITARITFNLISVNNVVFGLVLGEATGSSGAWPLINVFGPGTTAVQCVQCVEALTDFSYNSTKFTQAIVNASQGAIWLRMKWDHVALLYKFYFSYDGKTWFFTVGKSKADFLFNARATHVGFGFYMNGANANGHNSIASCDYWLVS